MGFLVLVGDEDQRQAGEGEKSETRTEHLHEVTRGGPGAGGRPRRAGVSRGSHPRPRRQSSGDGSASRRARRRGREPGARPPCGDGRTRGTPGAARGGAGVTSARSRGGPQAGRGPAAAGCLPSLLLGIEMGVASRWPRCARISSESGAAKAPRDQAARPAGESGLPNLASGLIATSWRCGGQSCPGARWGPVFAGGPPIAMS
jgi:hypothetical protein